ncbi:MAG: hypothetical protein KFH87_06600 [Bacteroidetes bacterium]|nr:hypothetical protein [Bacteroidota bacterium]
MTRHVTVSILLLLVLSACGSRELSLEEFQRMAQEAEEETATVAGLHERMIATLQAYNQTVTAERRLEITPTPDAGLNAAQREMLASHIDAEEDISCRELLRDISAIQHAIDQSQQRLEEITTKLPTPHRVQANENHYTLCMEYLTTEHKLSRGQADSLVARVGLNSDIIEGFHIWFYYENGVFGTFVTQGEAHISPTVFAKVVKKHLIEQARDQGREEAFETILDSLKRSGALLSNFRRGATGL